MSQTIQPPWNPAQGKISPGLGMNLMGSNSTGISPAPGAAPPWQQMPQTGSSYTSKVFSTAFTTFDGLIIKRCAPFWLAYSRPY